MAEGDGERLEGDGEGPEEPEEPEGREPRDEGHRRPEGDPPAGADEESSTPPDPEETAQFEPLDAIPEPVSKPGDARGGEASDEDPELVFEREVAGPLRRGRDADIEEVIRRHPAIEKPLRVLWAYREEPDDRDRRGLAPGDFVSHYEILEKIGEGGFGEVFLALQREPVRRRVVVKVLRGGIRSREALGRFAREGQALMLLEHPGIARFHEAGRARDGRPFLAMEHVAGEPITDHCQRRALGLRERIELFLQVCDAIQYAHQRTIVHRDLKASNILVIDGKGKGPDIVKVIDFGLAKELEGTSLTVHSVTIDDRQVVGSLATMSPEQADPGRRGVDTRADVFSLGALLFELVTGRLPLPIEELRRVQEREGFQGVLRAVIESERPRPSRVAPAEAAAPELAAGSGGRVRDELDWVVKKALELDPAERFASVSELAAELRRWLADEPLLTRPPTIRYQARKFVRRHRRGVAVAAGLAIALVATGVAVRWFYRHRREVAARGVLVEVEAGAQAYRRALEDLAAAEGALAEERAGNPAARPPWRYRVEVALERKRAKLRAEVETRSQEVVETARRAIQEAPEGSAVPEEAERAIARLRVERLRQSEESGPVELGPETFRRRVEASGERELLDALRERRRFRIATDPPGADVWLYRFVEGETGLVPVPWRAAEAAGPVGSGATGVRSARAAPAGAAPASPSLLRVEKVWRPDRAPGLRAGDRIEKVAGRAVRTREDLARVLAAELAGAGGAPPSRGVDGGGEAGDEGGEAGDEGGEAGDEGAASEPKVRPVPVAVAGREERARFLIDPPDEGGGAAGEEDGEPADRFWPFFYKLGVTFAPPGLERSEANRIGRTAPGSPLAFSLPEGSYLLLLDRGGGRPAVRYPIVSPRPEGVKEAARVTLAESLPDGFVWIPGGPQPTGGDRDAFQSLPWGLEEVGDFAIGRFEVTTGEWLEFVNDPETIARTYPSGNLKGVKSSEVRDLLEEKGKAAAIRIVPHRSSAKKPRDDYWLREAASGRWRLNPELWSPDWPIMYVSHLAALEYAAWRDRRALARGERWSYRLPTALEWERAARGVDRRAFPWGDHMVWSRCSSPRGNRLMQLRSPVTPAGAIPLDESPFGVRDLAGSAQEHNADRVFPPSRFPSENLRYRVVRGGGWSSEDEYFYRASTRNGRLPERVATDCGLRLVAVPRRIGPEEEKNP